MSPLTWLFHSRNMQHRINKALKLVCNESGKLNFDELLVKDNSVITYQKKPSDPILHICKYAQVVLRQNKINHIYYKMK